MARARHNFERAQLGRETIWGTEVPATYIMPGLRTIRYQATDPVVRAQKLNGSLALSDAADVVGKSAAATLGGYACPANLLPVLEGTYGQVVPTGTAPAFTRLYAPTRTAEDVPQSYSMEVGSNIPEDHWLMRGGLPGSFDITGKLGDMDMFTSAWIGRALEPHAMTASLTPGPYTRMRAKRTRFFIDPVSGVMGATQVAGCITEYAFHSGPLWALVNCMDGQDEASGYAQEPIDPSAVITIQLGADSLSWFNSFEAGQQVYLRMQLPGVQISPGPPVVEEMIQIDMCANLTTWPEVGDNEAEHGLVAAVTFSGSEDNTGAFAKVIEYTVVSDLPTLP